MTPGIPIFIVIAGGLLYALSQKKKAADEMAKQREQGASPETTVQPEAPPSAEAPPSDQGIPPFEPSPPARPTYQPPPPSYGAPPPTQQLPPGVPENWARATQVDVNRDGMLARFKEFLYSDKPVGAEIRIYQNGRWWKLQIVSRQTNPTTTMDRDVRAWLLPPGTPPPAAQPPSRRAGRPAPPTGRPAPGRAPAYPARPPYTGPIPHRPAPPPPRAAQYPGAYPPPHAAPGYPPQHAAYPPHAYPPPGYPSHAAPGYPQPIYPAQHAPPMAFGAPHAAPAYGAPPYGAPHGAPPPHAAPPRRAPAATAAFRCTNWVRATDHDVARDGVAAIYHSMVNLPAGTERPPEQNNGRWWKFKVVSKATDPQETLSPGKTKDVRGWVCQDSSAAAAASGNGNGGGIVGYMQAFHIPRLPSGEYSVHVETSDGFAPLVSGSAPEIASGYRQWLTGGGNPNATVYVRQAS